MLKRFATSRLFKKIKEDGDINQAKKNLKKLFDQYDTVCESQHNSKPKHILTSLNWQDKSGKLEISEIKKLFVDVYKFYFKASAPEDVVEGK